jgi:hypothetical protein
MKRVLSAAVALALLAPLVSGAASAAPKNDKAVVASEKKPGKTCHSQGPGSSAFKDCIQTQAHTGQSDNGKGKGQAKKP